MDLEGQQESAGGFEISDNIVEESRCGTAIHEAVVVGQAQRHHQPRLDRVVRHDHGELSTATDQKNCDFRDVYNGGAVLATDRTEVTDRECPPSEIADGELPTSNVGRHLSEFPGDIGDAHKSAVRFPNLPWH